MFAYIPTNPLKEPMQTESTLENGSVSLYKRESHWSNHPGFGLHKGWSEWLGEGGRTTTLKRSW